MRADDVAVVVAHRLLDEDMFARVERLEDQILMIAAGHDVDDVDVGSSEQLLCVGHHVGDLELGRAILGERAEIGRAHV